MSETTPRTDSFGSTSRFTREVISPFKIGDMRDGSVLTLEQWTEKNFPKQPEDDIQPKQKPERATPEPTEPVTPEYPNAQLIGKLVNALNLVQTNLPDDESKARIKELGDNLIEEARKALVPSDILDLTVPESRDVIANYASGTNTPAETPQQEKKPSIVERWLRRENKELKPAVVANPDPLDNLIDGFKRNLSQRISPQQEQNLKLYLQADPDIQPWEAFRKIEKYNGRVEASNFRLRLQSQYHTTPEEEEHMLAYFRQNPFRSEKDLHAYLQQLRQPTQGPDQTPQAGQTTPPQPPGETMSDQRLKEAIDYEINQHEKSLGKPISDEQKNWMMLYKEAHPAADISWAYDVTTDFSLKSYMDWFDDSRKDFAKEFNANTKEMDQLRVYVEQNPFRHRDQLYDYLQKIRQSNASTQPAQPTEGPPVAPAEQEKLQKQFEEATRAQEEELRKKQEQDEAERKAKEQAEQEKLQEKKVRVTENMGKANPVFEALTSSGYTQEAQLLRDAIANEKNGVIPGWFMNADGTPRDPKIMVEAMRMHGILPPEPSPIRKASNWLGDQTRKYGVRFVRSN